MTRHLAALSLAGAALAGSLLPQSGAQEADVGARLGKLESSQSELDRKLAGLAADVRANSEEIAAIQAYLQKQASAAKQMQATLDASEKAGFTYGINPESRHLLLAGWRDKLASELSGVPGDAGPAEKAAKAERAPR